MAQPAAKMGDGVMAPTNTHIVTMPNGAQVVQLLPFTGKITGDCSGDVNIMGLAAAMVGSTADNIPPHIAIPPGVLTKPPSNKGRIVSGSGSVFINQKAAARNGDAALTCNDPVDLVDGKVVAAGTVFIGG